MASATKLPFGTALALAQRTLTAPLAAFLETEKLAMPEWFTLNALGLRGPARLEALAGLLATNGLNEQATRALIASLDDAGLVRTDAGVLSLTPVGAYRYAALRDRIGLINASIFEGFDAQRVETARGLLQEIAGMDPKDLLARVDGQGS